MYRSALLPSGRRAIGATAGAAVAALALSVLPVGAANAAAPAQACDTRTNLTYEKLLHCVTVEGVLEHEEALQAIADANGGNRAAGTAGLRRRASTTSSRRWRPPAGRSSTRRVPLRLRRPVHAPAADPGHRRPTRRRSSPGTGYGEVTATVIPVDLNLANPPRRPAGARPGDFTGDFPVRTHRAHPAWLLQLRGQGPQRRGGGRLAVIIFNQGTPDRLDLIVGTLFGGNDIVDIPVVGASFAAGRVAVPGRLDRAGHGRRSRSSARRGNVIAELPVYNDDNVVMAGAHLDSVQAGPGINDNGSGSSALLEIAQQIAKVKPENTVRFAWWGAEESGLHRVHAVRGGPRPGGEGPDRALPQLRHGGLAELHLHGVRRQRVQLGRPGRCADPGGLGPDRGPLREPLHQDGRALRRRAVQRSQRLPGLHQQRDPVGWSLHRRRGRQDRGTGGDLGR